MIENTPLSRPNETIFDVKRMLFEKMKKLEKINYYVKYGAVRHDLE